MLRKGKAGLTLCPFSLNHYTGVPAGQLDALWWALAAGACLGGNGSLIGASANLIVAGIAERSGVPIRFLPFMKVAFPIMLLQVSIGAVYVWWRYL